MKIVYKNQFYREIGYIDMNQVLQELNLYYDNSDFEKKLFLLYKLLTLKEKEKYNEKENFSNKIKLLVNELFDIYNYNKIVLDTKHKIIIINIIRKGLNIFGYNCDRLKLNTNNITSLITREYINYISICPFRPY